MLTHHELPDGPFSSLSPREREIMLCVARGQPNKLISANLGISRRTVETHRANMFRKLHIRNAIQLANYIWQQCPPAVAGAITGR